MASDLVCLAGAAFKNGIAPKPYPTEFRDDVHLARNREPAVRIEKISKDFAVHPMAVELATEGPRLRCRGRVLKLAA